MVNLSLDYEIYPLKKLNEGASVFSGFAFKSNDFSDEGIPIVKIKNIQNKSVDLKEVQYFPLDKVNNKHKKFFLKNNDVLIAMTGQGSLGRVGRINLESNEYVLLNQRVGKFVVDEKNLHLNYLYHVISSDMYEKILFDRGTGSGQPNLSPEIILGTEIPMPNLTIQKKISSILDNINSKITLNKKINKNLEQLMKCIFEDWFVNFNYSNDISFKSSELGEIPSNWNVKKLRDVLIVLESGKRPKGGISNIDDGIPSIGAENILGLGKFNYSKNKLISHEFFSTLKKGVIQDKDVLLYKDGAQLGRKSLFMKGFPFDICCINEHVFRLQSNDEINQFYLYLWLDQEVMTNEIINLNSNSAQPGINQNDVKSLPILVPELKIISKFNKIISPMMNQIFDNALKINKLTNLRDTLLPKLMSGEIDVSKINCDLELKYNYMKYLFNQIHKQLSKSVV